MLTRFLFWNIQNFTYNKIDFTGGGRLLVPVRDMVFRLSRTTTLKNEYILDNIVRTDPDVFVVIEVISGRGVKGSLVTSRGAVGILALAERMRKLNTNWCLVPPLKLTDKIQVQELDEGEDDEEFVELVREGAYTEAIGVFFRKDKLDFIGPYVWPSWPLNDNPAKTSVAPGNGITPAAYPDEWQRYLPDNNYYAGQAEFWNAAGEELLFPDIGSRRPFLTKFREKEDKKRLITVASVHFPPLYGDATTAVVRLAGYLHDVYQIQKNEVMLIGGDFNINYFEDVLGTLPFLKKLGFTCLLNETFRPTMYRRADEATPENYRPEKGLDNVALRYGSEEAFQPYGVLVMNRVRNLRINGAIPSLLLVPMNTIMQQPTPAEQNAIFRQPYNFGRLGPNPGTSDHMAVYVQV